MSYIYIHFTEKLIQFIRIYIYIYLNKVISNSLINIYNNNTIYSRDLIYIERLNFLNRKLL